VQEGGVILPTGLNALDVAIAEEDVDSVASV
jgi:hypothetical protein